MYRLACRALLLALEGNSACDNYMPWNLTAQKPSIRSFRLAKSERSNLHIWKREREPTFRHESAPAIRFFDQKEGRDIRARMHVYVCFPLSLVWNFSRRDNRFPDATLRVFNTNIGNELEQRKDMRGRHSANISIVSGRLSDFLFCSS